MYRPKKRQWVRRAAVSSALGLVAVSGLGVALISQSGATSTALRAAKTTSAPTPTASSPTSPLSIAPKYHVVGRFHDDSQRASDGSQGYGDN